MDIDYGPDLPGEEWRGVVGYEDIYAVSNKGRLKRLKRGRGLHGRPRIMNFKSNPNRYVDVKLFKGSTKRRMKLHQLVQAAFVGPCPDGCEVNHKNGIKNDNRVENLEYVSRRENILHAIYVTKVVPIRSGEDASAAKLSDKQVLEILELHATGKYTQVELAQMYGVTQPSIHYAISGKRKLKTGQSCKK